MIEDLMLTTDLKMLVATAVLALISFLPYFVAYLQHWGIAGTVGNRVDLPELPRWSQRAQAAHQNLTENLVHFSVLVIVAHIIGASNDITAIGATLFFWARVAYLIVFTMGIPWVRTITFMAGWVGEVMILTQLV